MSELQMPIVPEGLERFYEDPEKKSVIERWMTSRPSDLLDNMPELTQAADRQVGYLVPEGDVDDSELLVMFLPHQQTWKPSMFLRAELARQLVVPNGRAVVFPNSSAGKGRRVASLSAESCEAIEAGDDKILTGLHVAAVELVPHEKTLVTGYSLGAWSALRFAKVGAGYLDITAVNTDELTSKPGRSPKELDKDFMKSGAWSDQRAAIRDSNIPALAETLNIPRLAMDYVRFGAATFLRENKALRVAMAGSAEGLLAGALDATEPDQTYFKLGSVAGSLICQETFPGHDRLRQVIYEGAGTHKHTTGDNIVAHALMVLDGLRQPSA